MSKTNDILLNFFHGSLTPEELQMKNILCGYLEANEMKMPSDESLKSDLGLSSVFIAKAAFLLNGFQLVRVFAADQGEPTQSEIGKC